METLSYLNINDSLRLKLEERLNEFKRHRVSYVEEAQEINSENFKETITEKKTIQKKNNSLFKVLFVNEYDTVKELFNDIGGQFSKAE